MHKRFASELLKNSVITVKRLCAVMVSVLIDAIQLIANIVSGITLQLLA